MIRSLFLSLNILAAVALVIAAAAAHIDPNVTAIPALFGMAFLPLFALNLLFFIAWFFWKRVFIVFSGAILLISLGTFRQHVHFELFDGEPQQGDVKLASYNVRLFDLYNWKSNKQTRDSILTYLDSLDADILCLQEFFKSNDNKHFNTLDTLVQIQRANQVHEEYCAITHKGFQQFGMATLSAYPIVESQRINLIDTKHNMAMWTDIQIGDDTVRVFNMHLASVRISALTENISEHIDKDDREGQYKDALKLIDLLQHAFRKRADQVKIVRRAINASPHPVIVCGDMNDTPGSFAYHEISKGLEDAFLHYGRGTGSTYIGFYPSFRIDYMLFSPELNITDFSTEELELSDHRPIVSTFNFGSLPKAE